MAEGPLHKQLKRQALFFLKNQVADLVAYEVKFSRSRCVADAVGINLKRKEVRVVEVKTSRSDFLRDEKLFDESTSYYYHAHFAYLLCPKDLIRKEEVPYGYGLLWAKDDGTLLVVKKPLRNNLPLKTRYDSTLKKSIRRLSNALLYEKKTSPN